MFDWFVKIWFKKEALTLLFVVLVLELFFAPMMQRVLVFRLTNTLILGLLLLAGLFTFSIRKSFRFFSVVFIVFAVGIRWTDMGLTLPGFFKMDMLVTLLGLLILMVVILKHVYRKGQMTWHKVLGGVSVYLLIAIIFAYAYCLAQTIIPGAFNIPSDLSEAGRNKVQAFYYFSVVTLTTVGYGDMTAVHPLARSLVMMEALIGQLFPAILIAHLVSLHITDKQNQPQKPRHSEP